ncbi:MAG: AAA family ATPase [Lentisphaeria bacterium]|nr:AAA family ATPase [Lentisphaeria bacterium]
MKHPEAFLKEILGRYKTDFDQQWKEEQYKWEAVKCFQDNWQIDAADFLSMMKAAFAKKGNLLDTNGNYPFAWIKEVSQIAPEEVRSMFASLYDEEKDVFERIEAFKQKAAALRNQYTPDANNHYQRENPITIYLWLRYPEQYYIYKFKETRKISSYLGLQLKYPILKGTYPDNVQDCWSIYNLIHQAVLQDTQLQSLFQQHLDDSCYPDHQFHILAMDVGYYISKKCSSNSSAIWDDDSLDSDEDVPLETASLMSSSNHPLMLNTILYGPPGTGKTYEMRRLADKYFTSENIVLAEEERIDSIAASLSWWEVAALILKDTGRSMKVSEIKDHPLMEAKIRSSDSAEPERTIWATMQSHTVDECEFVKTVVRHDPKIFFKNQDSQWTVDETLLSESSPELLETYNRYKNQDQPVSVVKRYKFVTFHQSFCYEQFVEGITAEIDDESKQIAYKIKSGIFKTICKEANEHPDKNYALFIDEINRGNVSGIFGELITLIEEDKRGTTEVLLPYSRDPFTVPKNLYIIGSMNTADRSIDALDSALRRRFSFIEMQPDSGLLSSDGWKPRHLSIDLKDLLDAINERVEFLLDRDHRIGHSYFMVIRGDSKEEELERLRAVMRGQVIPLLEDYFFGDLKKVYMVLGPKLIEKRTTLSQSKLFPEQTDDLDLPEKAVWRVADMSSFTEDDFKTILQ